MAVKWTYCPHCTNPRKGQSRLVAIHSEYPDTVCPQCGHEFTGNEPPATREQVLRSHGAEFVGTIFRGAQS